MSPLKKRNVHFSEMSVYQKKIVYEQSTTDTNTYRNRITWTSLEILYYFSFTSEEELIYRYVHCMQAK